MNKLTDQKKDILLLGLLYLVAHGGKRSLEIHSVIRTKTR